MSKIQEALSKIQGAKRSGSSRRSGDGDTSETTVIARLVDRSVEDDSFVTSDRILHLDQEALRDAGLIAPEYHVQLLANQYRDIKRPLIAHAFGRRATQIERGNLIMVTSSIAGEGKTFTSINLALSMAQERDYSVLLVDADVAKPHISEMFGAGNEIGLLDVIENPGLDIRAAILPTDEHGLAVLPAGKPRPNAAELLASDAMDVVVEQLSAKASRRLVVLDSPPILQTSEAKVLSRLAGQIVLVVRAEYTARDALQAALSTFHEDQAVNLLLNQARYVTETYQYGYGYGNHSAEHRDAPRREQAIETENEDRKEIFK